MLVSGSGPTGSDSATSDISAADSATLEHFEDFGVGIKRQTDCEQVQQGHVPSQFMLPMRSFLRSIYVPAGVPPAGTQLELC